MDGAQENLDKQYILITPQAMGSIKVDPRYSKIIQMADPIRGQ
jgi:hypothetical protein